MLRTDVVGLHGDAASSLKLLAGALDPTSALGLHMMHPYGVPCEYCGLNYAQQRHGAKVLACHEK